jgi:hypothetical protein
MPLRFTAITNPSTQPVHRVVSWFRCAVHLPAAPHPTWNIGLGWPARRFLRLAYFLPLIYAAPVYLLTWLVIRGAFSLNSFEAAMADTYGLGRWPALGTFGVALPLLFTITVIGEAVWGLGEELGWRSAGMFPRLLPFAIQCIPG